MLMSESRAWHLGQECLAGRGEAEIVESAELDPRNVR